MPESKGRRKKATQRHDADNDRSAAAPPPNPGWYVPVMLGLMVLGLIWIVVFYLTQGSFPIGAIGNWNLALGFGFIIAGFLMTTNWR